MFLHLSVILFTGGKGRAWREACMMGAGGVHGKGVCVAGACVVGRAYMVGGGVCGRGCTCHARPPRTLRDMVSQWASGTHPTGMHS